MFNIKKFLDFHNIPVRERGENVKKTNFNINCPFCINEGRADDNFHLGIDPNQNVYGCWRDSRHRGKSLERLVKAILNISWVEAVEIVQGPQGLEMGTFEELCKNPWKTINVKSETNKFLKLPKEFIEIKKTGILAKFFDYIQSRGFDNIEKLTREYKILCALIGEQANRVIFPIYFEGNLVSWTGRSIYDTASLRYQDLSVQKSLAHVKRCLYNYDNLDEGEILFVTEGIFDALKLDWYLPEQYRATCIFTKTLTEDQIYLISKLSKKFSEIRVTLDKDAENDSKRIVKELSFLKNISFQTLPKGVKDPGALSRNQILNLI